MNSTSTLCPRIERDRYGIDDTLKISSAAVHDPYSNILGMRHDFLHSVMLKAMG